VDEMHIDVQQVLLAGRLVDHMTVPEFFAQRSWFEFSLTVIASGIGDGRSHLERILQIYVQRDTADTGPAIIGVASPWMTLLSAASMLARSLRSRPWRAHGP
jgi:hypothetical protein